MNKKSAIGLPFFVWISKRSECISDKNRIKTIFTSRRLVLTSTSVTLLVEIYSFGFNNFSIAGCLFSF